MFGFLELIIVALIKETGRPEDRGEEEHFMLARYNQQDVSAFFQ